MKLTRVWSLVLIVVCLLLLLPLGVQGLSYEVQTIQMPLYINPEYADVLDPDKVELGLNSAPSVLTEPEYTDEAAAVTLVREYLKGRFGEFNVYVEVPEGTELSVLFSSMFEQAMEHTGQPTEGDYLNRHWNGYGGSISYYRQNGNMYATLTYRMGYYTTAEQEEALTAAVQTLLDSLDLYDVSDYEKIRGIYDYMTHNIAYDYDGLDDDADMLEYTAYKALVHKTSVCQGYASLFYRLSLTLGVDARYISGTANGGGHGWNIVKLGTQYYYLDATWDAPRAEREMDYDYFLLGSENFTADHTPKAEYTTEAFAADYPISTEDHLQLQLFNNTTLVGTYPTFEQACSQGTSGDYRLRLMRDVATEHAFAEDLCVDLNGYDLTGICVNGTVYGMDSTTDGYVSTKAGRLVLSSGTVETDVKMEKEQLGSVKRYLAIPEGENAYSFHRFYFGITHITLRPKEGGFGYKAEFAGDRVVRSYLDPQTGFGILLSTEAVPQSLTDGQCAAEGMATFPGEGKSEKRSLLLKNILNTDLSADEIAERADTVIYARTFLQTKDGTLILSTPQSNTIKAMVEQVDKTFPGYYSNQKSLLAEFYATYRSVMSAWELPNIKSRAEGHQAA